MKYLGGLLILILALAVNATAETLVGSYTVAPNSTVTMTTTAASTGISQCFTPLASLPLARSRFYAYKEGSPTGNVVSKLYAVSGSCGTDATPTGSALATSSTVPASALGTTNTDTVDFVFDGSYMMSNAVVYAITIEYSSGDVTNHVVAGRDTATLTDPGNYSINYMNTWAGMGVNTRDTPFWVYGTSGVNTYYVAPSSTNTTNCTNALSILTPMQGIQNFFDRCSLSPGDIVNLRGGTYVENVTPPNMNGSSGAHIIIQSYPGESATIQPPSQGSACGNATGAWSFTCATTGLSYVDLYNLKFDCANAWTGEPGQGPTCFTTGGGAVTHMEIHGGEVFNGGGTGTPGPHNLPWPYCGRTFPETLSSSNANFFSIPTISVFGLKSYHSAAHGIYGATGLVDGVESYENCQIGMQKYPTGSNSTIRNSSFHDNIGDGLILAGGSNNLVYNNIMYNNMESGLALEYGEGADFIYNNTLYHNGIGSCCGNSNLTDGLHGNNAPTGSTYTNNIIYNSGLAAEVIVGLNLSDPSPTVFTTNRCGSMDVGCATTGNPNFLNPGAADFHLTSSGGAGTGTNLTSAFTTDRDGLTRPSMGDWDIGAYLFTSCTPAKLLWVLQPQNTTFGGSVGNITVGVFNSSDMLCGVATNSITIANTVATCSGMTPHSATGLTGNALNGLRVLNDINETGATPGNCTLTATSGILTPAVSDVFGVQDAAVPPKNTNGFFAISR